MYVCIELVPHFYSPNILGMGEIGSQKPIEEKSCKADHKIQQIRSIFTLRPELI